MGKVPRVDIAEHYYHVLNRGNAKQQIFFDESDYRMFESVLLLGIKKFDIEVYAYCVMPNHFHFVLKTLSDGEMGRFMQWITLTHTSWIHVKNDSVGYGHIYQGRYKSFVIEDDIYLQAVLRYVEQNPLRAGLVTNLEEWVWTSFYKRKYYTGKLAKNLTVHPYQQSKEYETFVSELLPENVYSELKKSSTKGKPFGSEEWVNTTIEQYGLQATIRTVGRPRNQ